MGSFTVDGQDPASPVTRFDVTPLSPKSDIGSRRDSPRDNGRGDSLFTSGTKDERLGSPTERAAPIAGISFRSYAPIQLGGRPDPRARPGILRLRLTNPLRIFAKRGHAEAGTPGTSACVQYFYSHTTTLKCSRSLDYRMKTYNKIYSSASY